MGTDGEIGDGRLKLCDDRRARRAEAQEALRSYWVNAYLGLYLTAEERERFRRLDADDLSDFIHYIKTMKRRGFDAFLAREVRRAVLAPGEPDTPVAPRAAVGALFGPPAMPPPSPGPGVERHPPARPGLDRGRRRNRRRDDPGQRLLPFMTPSLLERD